MRKLFLALLSMLSLPLSANEPPLSGPLSPTVFSIYHDKALHHNQQSLIENNDDTGVIRAFRNAGLIQQNVQAFSRIGKVDGNTDWSDQSGFLNGGPTSAESPSLTNVDWDSLSSGKRGWGMAWDLGVLYEGESVGNLNVSCSAGLTAGQCASLAADVEAESMQLRSDIVEQKWYPVFSLGFLYRF